MQRFFPFKFNTPENQNYIGRYPDLDFYDINNLKENRRKELIEFYEKNKNNIFNFKQELLNYCISDVELLKSGCLIQRLFLLQCAKNINSQIAIDPFSNSITLPSYCHKLYRNLFMKDKSIAVIPENGYKFNQTTSKKCYYWLEYLNFKYNYKIKHAKNSKEYRIKSYKLDGFDQVNQLAFEFHGWYVFLFILN